jgi:glycosyltransferase involved in cell wall biosynthesis
MDRPLVSILIPAYNQPEYLAKCLASIREQDYRPIEVFVSDDGSPTELCPVVEAFQRTCDAGITVRFVRQPKNLGTQDNFRFLVREARGKYAVPWAHDNWFTDPRFLTEAVGHLSGTPGCHVCVANAHVEGETALMLNIPAEMTSGDGWSVLPGGRFVPHWGLLTWPGCIGWSQAVVLNLEVARRLGLFDYPYAVDGALADRLGIGADNGSAYVAPLASLGTVALTGKAVCVAGQPPNSYSRSERWQRTANDCMFLISFNVYKSRLKGPYQAQLRWHARNFLLHAHVRHLNWRVLRTLRYHPQALAFMLRSYVGGKMPPGSPPPTLREAVAFLLRPYAARARSWAVGAGGGVARLAGGAVNLLRRCKQFAGRAARGLYRRSRRLAGRVVRKFVGKSKT